MGVLEGTVTVAQGLLKDVDTDLQILGTSESPSDGRDLLAPELIGRLLTEQHVARGMTPQIAIHQNRSCA